MKQAQREQLAEYAELLRRYHATLDLVSPAALASVDRLIEDAAVYAQAICELSPAARSILDLGSGAGLPGIPIAVMLPHIDVCLVERRRRRATFLTTVRARLGLERVRVAQADVRALDEPVADAVTAQWVGTLAQIYRLTTHLHGERVVILSRKSEDWTAELTELQDVTGTAAQAKEWKISGHGRLVGVCLAGGLACRPSG